MTYVSYVRNRLTKVPLGFPRERFSGEPGFGVPGDPGTTPGADRLTKVPLGFPRERFSGEPGFGVPGDPGTTPGAGWGGINTMSRCSVMPTSCFVREFAAEPIITSSLSWGGINTMSRCSVMPTSCFVREFAAEPIITSSLNQRLPVRPRSPGVRRRPGSCVERSGPATVRPSQTSAFQCDPGRQASDVGLAHAWNGRDPRR